ncbi:MAG TPA: cytochrome bc complex cytochrome b subunit, partial [Geobacterales bacterium]|nr:cytochrome bc complex cytochrome b subunit [Geobacterales bacterium]
DKELTGYLLPRNINALYSLGSVLLVIFALQVTSGILLLVNYVPHTEDAFTSVTTIMNQVPFGWLIRLTHAVGASMMVAMLLLHLLSVLFMGSYKRPRELNWLSGFMLFNLVLGICLTGYLLPWSQLSFWATTVATNSFSSIPVIGTQLVTFVRGGPQVGPATLGRFFALHVTLLPLMIGLFIALHLFFLKRAGVSTPPFGFSDSQVQWQGDRYIREDHPGGIPFFPHYMLQDMTSILLVLALLFTLVFFFPSLFFPSSAFIPANPLQTPAQIKPEWYFLANYQTLRLFPNELIGILIQVVAMTFLALLPFLDRGAERHPLRRPFFLFAFSAGIVIYLTLTIWGHYS